MTRPSSESISHLALHLALHLPPRVLHAGCLAFSLSRFLTDKGIEYLREYLNLPSEIVPATLKKSTRPLERGPAGRPERGDRPPRRDGPPREGGRDGYRSAAPREGGFGRGGGAPGGDKAGAPGAFQPSFGGAGRGQ